MLSDAQADTVVGASVLMAATAESSPSRVSDPDEAHPGLYAALRHLGTLGHDAASELCGVLRANSALRASALENLVTSLYMGTPDRQDWIAETQTRAGVPRRLLGCEWPRMVDILSAQPDDLVKSRALQGVLKNLTRLRLASSRASDLALVLRHRVFLGGRGLLRMRELRVSISDAMQPAERDELADAIERLELLSILDLDFGLGSRTASVLARRCCPQLTELCARVSVRGVSSSGAAAAGPSGPRTTPAGPSRLAALVVDFDFDDHDSSFDALAAVLRGLPASLEKVTLSGLPQAVVVAALAAAEPMPQVVELSIRFDRRGAAAGEEDGGPDGPAPVEDDSFLRGAFPALRKLSLEWTTTDVARFSVGAPLEELCFYSSGSSLSFGPACREKLVALHVRKPPGCRGSLLAFEEIVQMPRLRALKLEGVARLLEQPGQHELQQQRERQGALWRDLEEFAVYDAAPILDKGMIQLFRLVGRCPTLRRLRAHVIDLKLFRGNSPNSRLVAAVGPRDIIETIFIGLLECISSLTVN